MIEKFRHRLAAIFEKLEEEDLPSVKLVPIFLWAMFGGIIGGIAPFVWITNHRLLVAYLSALIFFILTIKPVLKRSIKHDD